MNSNFTQWLKHQTYINRFSINHHIWNDVIQLTDLVTDEMYIQWRITQHL